MESAVIYNVNGKIEEGSLLLTTESNITKPPIKPRSVIVNRFEPPLFNTIAPGTERTGKRTGIT